ncbi:MAG: polysaccharide biosynthesis/export family protein [Bryobacteraceae bacterium]
MPRRALVLGSILLCLFIFLSASCAQGAQEKRQETAPPAQVSPEEEALRKSVGAPVDPNTYLIGAEDILQVRVWREPDLSGPVSVRPDGKISLPLIGDLQAGGITPLKLAELIREGLVKYVTEPEVMVSVLSVNSKKYFVIGEVNRPGQYPLVVPTTISQALTIAGGFREYADTKNILIMRGPKRYKFNYRDWVKGKNLSQNLLLEGGDQIIVP